MTGYELASQPLPPLTRDLSDAWLAEAIRRQPSIFHKAGVAATTDWKNARSQFHMIGFADMTWAKLVQRCRNVHGDVAQLRAALEASAVMRALAGLPDRTASLLRDAEHHSVNAPAMWNGQVAQAMASHPDLAWFQAIQDAEAVRMAALQQQQQADAHARYLAERPAATLAALRKRKVALSLNDAGQIIAPAGTALSDADRQAIKADRDAIRAILTAEMAAAAPVVVL